MPCMSLSYFDKKTNTNQVDGTKRNYPPSASELMIQQINQENEYWS